MASSSGSAGPVAASSARGHRLLQRPDEVARLAPLRELIGQQIAQVERVVHPRWPSALLRARGEAAHEEAFGGEEDDDDGHGQDDRTGHEHGRGHFDAPGQLRERQ